MCNPSTVCSWFSLLLFTGNEYFPRSCTSEQARSSQEQNLVFVQLTYSQQTTFNLLSAIIWVKRHQVMCKPTDAKKCIWSMNTSEYEAYATILPSICSSSSNSCVLLMSLPPILCLLSSGAEAGPLLAQCGGICWRCSSEPLQQSMWWIVSTAKAASQQIHLHPQIHHQYY